MLLWIRSWAAPWLMLLVTDAICEELKTNTTGNLGEYCESEAFDPRCHGDQVVAMTAAKYGRMELGTCVESNLGYLGCYKDVLHILDRKCSGKASCNVRIPDGELDNTEPCLSELRLYLQASYKCIRVESSKQLCGNAPSPITVTSNTAYISSQHLLASSLCAGTDRFTTRSLSGPRRHWTLQALPGQVLSISLVDFSWQIADEDTGVVNGDKSSLVLYGYIVEEGTGRNVTLYGGSERTRHILTSNGSSVQLTLIMKEGLNFLIKYEAMGCADLRPPRDAWLKRVDDELIVGCKDTRQTWHLRCQERHWVGVIGNCTQHLVAARKQAKNGRGYSSLPHDVTIVLIVGISLLICAAIVISGLLCLKRLNRKPCCQGPVKYDNVHSDDVTYKDQDPSYLSPKYGKNREHKSPRKPKNDYSHIWEHPLPDPVSAAEIFNSQQQLPSPKHLKVKLPPKAPSRSCSVNNTGSGSDDAYHVSMASKSSKGESTKYFVLDKDIGPSCVESPSHCA